MSVATRRGGTRMDPATALLGVVVVLVVVGGGAVWLAVVAGSRMEGVNRDLSADPFTVLADLARGRLVWTLASTVVLLVLLGLAVAAAIAVVTAVRNAAARRTSIDGVAVHLARGRELSGIRVPAAGRREAPPPGIPIGRTIAGRLPVQCPPGGVLADVTGSRRAVVDTVLAPAVLSAPGAVVVVTARRDLVDATRAARAAQGEVLVVDPAGAMPDAVESRAGWWWHPLAAVTDSAEAGRLARCFASGPDPTTRSPTTAAAAGRELLAALFLAAARSGRSILDAREWALARDAAEPSSLLDARGETGAARLVQSLLGGAPTTGVPHPAVSWVITATAGLADPVASRWVLPRDGDPLRDPRRRLDPAGFPLGRDTLYVVVDRAPDPLAASLVSRLLDAASSAADPMLLVVEAESGATPDDLPFLSPPRPGATVLASSSSWADGVSRWGEDGMRTLWTSAAVAVYGGGSKEPAFLERVSQLAGDRRREGGARERILDVADLAALPDTRAVVIPSAGPATLVARTPWQPERRHRRADAAGRPNRGAASTVSSGATAASPTTSYGTASYGAAPSGPDSATAPVPVVSSNAAAWVAASPTRRSDESGGSR